MSKNRKGPNFIESWYRGTKAGRRAALLERTGVKYDGEGDLTPTLVIYFPTTDELREAGVTDGKALGKYAKRLARRATGALPRHADLEKVHFGNGTDRDIYPNFEGEQADASLPQRLAGRTYRTLLDMGYWIEPNTPSGGIRLAERKFSNATPQGLAADFAGIFAMLVASQIDPVSVDPQFAELAQTTANALVGTGYALVGAGAGAIIADRLSPRRGRAREIVDTYHEQNGYQINVTTTPRGA